MRIKDFDKLIPLTETQIQNRGRWLTAGFIASVLVLVASLIWFSSAPGTVLELLSFGLFVASLISAYSCINRMTDDFEISADAYTALQSHKSNQRIKSYIDSVHAVGRSNITRSEYYSMINYAQNQLPFLDRKSKLFDTSPMADDFDAQRRRKADAFETLVNLMFADAIIEKFDEKGLKEFLQRARALLITIPSLIAKNYHLENSQLKLISSLDPDSDGVIKNSDWAQMMKRAFNQMNATDDSIDAADLEEKDAN